MSLWVFEAQYDAEAQILWTGNDALGITTEGETLETIAAKLEVMVSEMVAENVAFLTKEQRRGPHEFWIIAHHELQRRAA